MRLIDADALIEDLGELLYTDENPSEQLTDAGQAIHNAAIALAASEVTDAPTIDASPVVHARWEDSEHRDEKYRCSACGGACWYYDYQGAVARSRFCPNCGAKMDEKEDEK